MKKSTKTRRKRNPLPTITRVRLASSCASQRPRKQVSAGDLIEIVGRGFGKSASVVRVLFDEHSVRPFRHSFTEKRIVLVAPLSLKATRSIVVEVAGKASKPYPLRVVRPRKASKEPGKPTGELLSALDELSELLENIPDKTNRDWLIADILRKEASELLEAKVAGS